MSNNTYPVTVKCGTVSYRITQDPDEWMKVEHSTQTKGYYGHTNHQLATIYLNPEATDAVTRLTLWHEVLHATLEATAGAPDWRHLGKDKDAREEAVIRRLEHPTLTVLRDNPALVEYLTGRL